MDEARTRFSLRIPEDLCIVGYDNIAQSGWSSYNLTTFAPPMETFSREAVQWLVAQEKSSHELDPRVDRPSDKCLYEASVVWRGSVRGG
jgi:DNA-binding LacI/PurR family transcriptional regulator